jgi:hypothetical protein
MALSVDGNGELVLTHSQTPNRQIANEEISWETSQTRRKGRLGIGSPEFITAKFGPPEFSP